MIITKTAITTNTEWGNYTCRKRTRNMGRMRDFPMSIRCRTQILQLTLTSNEHLRLSVETSLGPSKKYTVQTKTVPTGSDVGCFLEYTRRDAEQREVQQTRSVPAGNFQTPSSMEHSPLVARGETRQNYTTTRISRPLCGVSHVGPSLASCGEHSGHRLFQRGALSLALAPER